MVLRGYYQIDSVLKLTYLKSLQLRNHFSFFQLWKKYNCFAVVVCSIKSLIEIYGYSKKKKFHEFIWSEYISFSWIFEKLLDILLQFILRFKYFVCDKFDKLYSFFKFLFNFINFILASSFASYIAIYIEIIVYYCVFLFTRVVRTPCPNSEFYTLSDGIVLRG